MNTYDDVLGPVDASELAERHWPYDGPYDPASTLTAGQMIERLVRYLNNATQKRAALGYAATAGGVLAHLHAAVASLEQLAGQLARFAEQQAHDPTLYDDRRDRPGAQTALDLADELADLRPVVVELGHRLELAAGHAYHLGNQP